jgi:hypothetical protein
MSCIRYFVYNIPVAGQGSQVATQQVFHVQLPTSNQFAGLSGAMPGGSEIRLFDGDTGRGDTPANDQ